MGHQRREIFGISMPGDPGYDHANLKFFTHFVYILFACLDIQRIKKILRQIYIRTDKKWLLLLNKFKPKLIKFLKFKILFDILFVNFHLEVHFYPQVNFQHRKDNFKIKRSIYIPQGTISPWNFTFEVH